MNDSITGASKSDGIVLITVTVVLSLKGPGYQLLQLFSTSYKGPHEIYHSPGLLPWGIVNVVEYMPSWIVPDSSANVWDILWLLSSRLTILTLGSLFSSTPVSSVICNVTFTSWELSETSIVSGEKVNDSITGASKSGAYFTSIGEILSTPFLTTERLFVVSFTNSFPSVFVTVNVKPPAKSVGGITSQNCVASSFVAPSSTGVSQVSVTEVSAVDAILTVGFPPTVWVIVDLPDINSPLLPSSLMEETDTPSP